MQRAKIMLKGFKPGKIVIVCGRTDLRQGIDGLASIISNQYNLNLYDDTLFLFCGIRNDRIKGLYWDANGFVLLYKRLEQGSFRWPRNTSEAKTISRQQYEWLISGFEIEPRNKPVDTRNFTLF